LWARIANPRYRGNIKTGFSFKFGGKELQEELGLNDYDFGARNYDPALGRWMNIDPLAEKTTNISSYTYVADNPITNIDPDGNDIIFIVRGGKGKADMSLTYRNGNFYHDIHTGKGDGVRYNPSKESLSPTLYKVLAAYRKIEESNDIRLKKVLHHLETSKLHHFVEDGKDQPEGYRNDEHPEGEPKGADAKDGIGSRTYYCFSKEEEDYSETKGVLSTDLDIVTHEMRHQFDDDIGNSADNTGKHDENNPVEQRAVFFENLARQIEKIMKRRKYVGNIPSPALVNPSNNIFDDKHIK
jgi:RHS repeat-associated protein